MTAGERWALIKAHPKYDKADPRKQVGVRKKFFEDFIQTQPNFPQDIDAAWDVRNKFIIEGGSAGIQSAGFGEVLKEQVKKIPQEGLSRLDLMKQAKGVAKATANAIVPGGDIIIDQDKQLRVSKGAEEVGKTTFERPLGAFRAVLNGATPWEGFKNPRSYNTGAAIAEALDMYGIENVTANTAIGGVIGTIIDLGAMSFLYRGLARRGAKGQAVKVRAHGEALDKLKVEMNKEFIAAGASKEEATSIVNELVANEFAKGTLSRKVAQDLSDKMKQFPGKLAERIMSKMKTADKAAASGGFDTTMKKILDNNRGVHETTPIQAGVSPKLAEEMRVAGVPDESAALEAELQLSHRGEAGDESKLDRLLKLKEPFQPGERAGVSSTIELTNEAEVTMEKVKKAKVKSFKNKLKGVQREDVTITLDMLKGATRASVNMGVDEVIDKVDAEPPQKNMTNLQDQTTPDYQKLDGTPLQPTTSTPIPLEETRDIIAKDQEQGLVSNVENAKKILPANKVKAMLLAQRTGKDVYEIALTDMEGNVKNVVTTGDEIVNMQALLGEKGKVAYNGIWYKIMDILGKFDINNEKGYIRIGDYLKQVVSVGRATRDALLANAASKYNALAGALDVEYPWKKIGSPDTGFMIKTNLSKAALGQEKALDIVAGYKDFNLSRSDLTELAFATESTVDMDPQLIERLKPAIEYTKDKVFRKYLGILAKRDPFHFKNEYPYPKNRIIRNNDEMADLKRMMKDQKATSPSYKKRLKRLIELKSENKFFEDYNIEFVHIPTRIWFEKHMNANPELYKKISGGSFSQILGRTTPTLRDLVRTGMVKREDIDIRDIVGNYVSYVEKQLAELDIVDAMKKDGLALPKDDPRAADWYSVNPRWAPTLRHYKVQPGVAPMLESYYQSINKAANPVQVLISIAKMMQFYNPLGIGVNNLQQAVLAGTLHKLPFYIGKAHNHIKNRTPVYNELMENGLQSTPFRLPFKAFKDDLENIKDSHRNLLLASIDRMGKYMKFQANPIKDIYILSWNTAWSVFDRNIRVQSALQFIDQGYTIREAAQLAAKFHGDYASVPAATRKVLNSWLFTPTFEIVMSKVYIDMIKGAAKAARGTVDSNFKATRGDKTDKAYAFGLLALAGSLFGIDQYMTRVLGFERQQGARRYYRRVETPDGIKEIVVPIATPANLWLRTYYDFVPGDGFNSNLFRGIERSIRRRLNPLLKLPKVINENRDEGGNYVYNPYDHRYLQALDLARTVTMRILRVAETIDKVPGLNTNLKGDKFAREKSIKALSDTVGIINAQLIDKLAFHYTRDVSDERFKRKIANMKREFSTYSNIAKDLEKTGGDVEKVMSNYVMRLNNYIKFIDAEVQREYRGDRFNIKEGAKQVTSIKTTRMVSSDKEISLTDYKRDILLKGRRK